MSYRTPSLGSLNRRIELLSKSEIADSTGGISAFYTSLGSAWAKAEQGTGGFEDTTGALSGRKLKTLIVRYRADVHAGDRVVFEGETYDVQSVDDPNGRNAYLRILIVASEPTGARYV